MAKIHELASQIENADLRERILAEVDNINKQKKFGLVFEEHLPECTPLYDIPIRKGGRVALKASSVSETFVVLKIKEGIASCLPKGGGEILEYSITELVSVAEFGEAIYPCLKPINTVCNAPDSDLWHTLIEADNYHALQLLEYLYAGKVSCIYIDPPYNTGAKDWKYNNDYVDSADAYRHSKWLSMMQKRLRIAKKLLNPDNSVLIVTIDEKEYLHLGCLLEEMFPEAEIQMVTSVINPKGSARKNLFSRAEEYIFYIFMGNAHVHPAETDMIHPVKNDLKVRWASLLRSGSNSDRSARPNLFYPLYFSSNDGTFVSTGESLPLGIDKESVATPKGCFTVWPQKSNGQDARWTLSQDTLKEKIAKGYVKFGKWKQGGVSRTISYLADGMEKAMQLGSLEILGTDEDGSLITGRSFKPIVPLSVWNQPSHSAGDFGSSLLLNIFVKKRFTFPKSIYAVQDALRFFVASKPDALIVDFFAGSGTTLHAVNLLNAEDGGRRRCIMVTNNEVSVEEAKTLKEQGFQPGDTEWEKLGIARYVTWPRTVCSIEGHDINGNALKGNYLGSDMPMADGFKSNAAYFKLGFLDKTSVALGKQFKEMLPTLWMKAGTYGRCPEYDNEGIPAMLLLPENRFAILSEESVFSEFEEAVNACPEIETVYIVTDYEAGYRAMVKNLSAPNTYQLYRDYLDNFRINTGRN